MRRLAIIAALAAAICYAAFCAALPVPAPGSGILLPDGRVAYVAPF